MLIHKLGLNQRARKSSNMDISPEEPAAQDESVVSNVNTSASCAIDAETVVASEVINKCCKHAAY